MSVVLDALRRRGRRRLWRQALWGALSAVLGICATALLERSGHLPAAAVSRGKEGAPGGGRSPDLAQSPRGPFLGPAGGVLAGESPDGSQAPEDAAPPPEPPDPSALVMPRSRRRRPRPKGEGSVTFVQGAPRGALGASSEPPQPKAPVSTARSQQRFVGARPFIAHQPAAAGLVQELGGRSAAGGLLRPFDPLPFGPREWEARRGQGHRTPPSLPGRLSMRPPERRVGELAREDPPIMGGGIPPGAKARALREARVEPGDLAWRQAKEESEERRREWWAGMWLRLGWAGAIAGVIFLGGLAASGVWGALRKSRYTDWIAP